MEVATGDRAVYACKKCGIHFDKSNLRSKHQQKCSHIVIDAMTVDMGFKSQVLPQTQREDPPASKNRSEMVCHTADDQPSTNNQMFQQTQETEEPIVLLSEGNGNFSAISAPKSWHGVLNVKEAMQQTINELKEQNTYLKVFVIKLEEKVEVKDQELVQLRSQLGGTGAQRLKIEVEQMKFRLNEKDQQLNELREERQVKQKEWLNKEKEWLKMFGQVYNLSKDPDFYKDLKKALEGFQESLHNSKCNSPKNSNFCSQDGNSSPIKMEEEGPVDLHINGHQYQGDSMPIHRIDCTNMREVLKNVQKGQYIFENNSTKRTLGIRKHAKRPQLGKIKTSSAKQTHLYQETIETVLQQKKSKTPLEQRRDAQRTRIKDQFKSRKSQLMTVERWLLKLKQYQPNGFQLTKLGSSICDAIILPMCPLIFGEDKKQHDSKMKVFLLSQKIPVQNICESQRKNDRCVLIQLTDAKNAFTLELLQNLQKAMLTLRNNLSKIVLESMPTEQQKQQELENIYVRQIDYTQDLNGFFMSLSVRTDLNNLGNLLNIGHKNEYNQLNTLFQFTKAKDSHLVSRTKIYNKMVHLMTCHQFKKWMSMGLRKVFKASSDFYLDKIQPSIDSGLTRIEQSLYFRSVLDWETLENTDSVEQTITKTLEALNQMKDKLVYKVSFNVLWESFWGTVDENKTMIAFEPDAWAVCYGYCNRSYLYTGYDVDKTNHSGTMLNFIKRYAGKHTIVFIKDKEFLITKFGGVRQIPIDSLNVIQSKSYDFGINNEEFCYHLSEQQLDLISFTCDDPEFHAMFGEGPDLLNVNKSSDIDENYQEFDINSGFVQRKRSIKFNDKKEDRVKGNKIREREQNKEEAQSGINVTDAIRHHKDKKSRWITLLKEQYDQCVFICKLSSGRTYLCEHCGRTLSRRGKSQLFLV